MQTVLNRWTPPIGKHVDKLVGKQYCAFKGSAQELHCVYGDGRKLTKRRLPR